MLLCIAFGKRELLEVIDMTALWRRRERCCSAPG
jgi:hypothetical protein